jgi:hypothetical protein
MFYKNLNSDVRGEIIISTIHSLVVERFYPFPHEPFLERRK